jgi:uncharacterized membrane protein YeaQ/YmgE (transglycosylase-associated protein family)
MTLLEFVALLVVAGIVGAIAQALAGYSHGGCLTSIAIGFVGAIVGPWIARSVGLPEFFVVSVGGQPFPIVWSVLGATLFVALIGLLRYRRRPPPPP